MRASALRSTSTGSPDPSLPTSNAEAAHQSTSQGASSGCSPVSGSCTLDASILNPATFNCVIKIGSGGPDKTARCSAAPAAARNALGENGLAVPLCPDAEIAAPVAPNAAAVRKIVPTFPGSCTPANTTSSGGQTPSGAPTKSSNFVTRGATSAATPCGCSVSASPSKSRSVVVNTGKAISGRPINGASRSRYLAPASLNKTASMRHPERNASSTSLTPSTPQNPDSVGIPPRSAIRNCFSHRLSRLVSTAGAARTVEDCAVVGPLHERGVRTFRVTPGGAPGAPGGVLIARKRSILPTINALHQSPESRFSLVFRCYLRTSAGSGFR